MVKFNAKLQDEIGQYQTYVILVEGKKDVAALEHLGFTRVYAIHETGVGLRERVEQICAPLTRKDRVCILTDFDREGKHLYLQLKSLLSERGVKLDSRLRGILLKAGVSHIEGLNNFMKKVAGMR